IAFINLLRQQLNAQCPTRESRTNGTGCDWAKSGLGNELAGVLSRPLFASLVDVTDQVRQDDTSRRQIETFLQYALQATNDSGEDLQGTLASAADLLQVLLDDADTSP